MDSTSCKPSQDVSKRSREQIQPITISAHPPTQPHQTSAQTWPAFGGEGQVIDVMFY